MTRKTMIITGLSMFALILLTAGASAMITKEMVEKDEIKTEEVAVATPVKAKTVHHKHKSTSRDDITWNDNRQPVQQPPVREASACDDGNIVGTVVGGAAGGLGGSQIGNGNGKIAATIAGTLGGAYLGNRYVPARNVTCR